ncbi:feather keratin-like [Python bivittatus]|uniref:Feather keratin-like n=1 Tax=Python bivittatus TaxID=176946 RepID=A0A9F5IT06_PYTBI|nr:feather keratin-like [Python bivittatus]
MAFCGPPCPLPPCPIPSCAIPSCASCPSVGFGPGGLGGLASRSFGLPSGQPASSLGTLEGVTPSCINQIPAAEVVIQPPPVIVTLPGPILSASCDPVAVGGNTPCAAGGYGQGLPTGLLGGGSRQGSRYRFVGNRGSICYIPC